MNIEILGTRGNIEVQAPQYVRQSGILIDEKILLDLGEKEYLNLNFDCIFISHLHPDHAIFEEEEIPEISVPVFAPEPSSHYPVKVLSHPVTIDSYRVTPLPTIHSTRVTSVAFLVEKEASLLYTSDLVALSHEFSLQIDLAVIDGSFMRKKGLVRRTEKGEEFGHTGIPDLVHAFTDLTDTIVVTHYGSWFYRDIEKSITRIESLGNDVAVRAAHDGLVIHL